MLHVRICAGGRRQRRSLPRSFTLHFVNGKGENGKGDITDIGKKGKINPCWPLFLPWPLFFPESRL